MPTLAYLSTEMPMHAGTDGFLRTLQLLLERRGVPLNGASIACLGLMHKDGRTAAPARRLESLYSWLAAEGAMLRIFDPHIPERSTVRTLGEALEGADAALIVASRPTFETLTPEQLTKRGVTVVLDGCYCLAPEQFEDSEILYASA